MLMLIKTTEGESSDPSRANFATDYLRDLFPTDACAKVSWTLLVVAILVSMSKLGKSSQFFKYSLKAGLIVRIIS